MRFAPLVAVLTSILVGAAQFARAEDSPTKPPAGLSFLTDADRKFFAWWDARGFPDIGRLPFVKVWTGNWSRMGDQDPVSAVEAGFLLREEGTKFTVFLTDLRTLALETNVPADESKRYHRVGFERTDIEAYVREGLHAISKQDLGTDRHHRCDPFRAHRWSSWPVQAFRIAVLGRALAARGFDELAHTMCELSLHEADNGCEDPTRRPDFSGIETAIRSESIDVLESNFLNSDLSWADILAAHRAWRRAFERENGEWIDRHIALLHRMVEDARARREAPSKPFDEQSRPERIATLVHDLQDVNIRIIDTWGLFLRVRQEEESGEAEAKEQGKRRPKATYVQLAELGLEAVPALIEAVDDERFTRTMEQKESGKGNVRSELSVLRVGELAWRILDRISGGVLEVANGHERFPCEDSTRRRTAEAWFETVKSKGETTVLAEQILKGNRSSRGAAERLARLNPEAAVMALETGILATDELSGRENLADVLVSIRSEAATTALLRVLDRLGNTGSGIHAASALWARGRREGLDALIRWWKDRGKARNEGTWERFVWDHFGTRDLIRALEGTGHADAVMALGEDIEARSAEEREEIVTTFLPRDPEFRRSYDMAVSPAGEAAIETVLAEQLSDGERTGLVRVGSEPTNEPVIGETAARTLAKRYPDRWKFDAEASAADREAARWALVNGWRAAHGKPPIAPPPRVTVEPMEPKAAKPLVAAWLTAGNDFQAISKAEAAILEAGLGLLPHLQAARDAMAEDDSRHDALDHLVQRCSLWVREVRWSEKGPKPNPALTTYTEGIRGKPVTGQWITGLWRQVAVDTPEGATGITLTITRRGDGTGAVIALELTTGTVPWPGGDGGWILDGDGLEHVSDHFLKDPRSWWHESRAPQVDAPLLLSEKRSFYMKRTIQRARG